MWFAPRGGAGDQMHVSTIYKAPKGIIRVNAEINDNVLSNVKITGDFFLVPEDSIAVLERVLNGTKFSYSGVSDAVGKFYLTGAETPMVSKLDLVTAIMGVVGEHKTD